MCTHARVLYTVEHYHDNQTQLTLQCCNRGQADTTMEPGMPGTQRYCALFTKLLNLKICIKICIFCHDVCYIFVAFRFCRPKVH
jgi:hypothetical protein